jgi:hypothetical protein
MEALGSVPACDGMFRYADTVMVLIVSHMMLLCMTRRCTVRGTVQVMGNTGLRQATQVFLQ